MASNPNNISFQKSDLSLDDATGAKPYKKLEPMDLDQENGVTREHSTLPKSESTYKPAPPGRNPTDHLRKSAHAFAVAFASPKLNPVRFVDRFLTQTGSGPTIREHAPSYAAKPLPYVNRTFQGRNEAIEFLKSRNDTVRMLWFDGSVPADECIVVDPECRLDGNKGSWKYHVKGSACVVCKIQTEHLDSGWKWNETLIYKLTGFDEDGRFVQWDIWSDSLSAWSAARDKALQSEKSGHGNEENA